MAKDLTAALDALSGSGYSGSRQDTRLPGAITLPAIPTRTGAAGPQAAATGTGGVASPLVETSYAEREWFADRSVVSSDGLFTMRVRAIKKIKFSDANLNAVEIQYKEAP